MKRLARLALLLFASLATPAVAQDGTAPEEMDLDTLLSTFGWDLAIAEI